MFLEAADIVIKDPVMLRLFRIPTDLWPAIRKSWGLVAVRNGTKEYYTDTNPATKEMIKKQMDLLGRFDWSWDGVSPPKLMEFNSDTPSLLIESSIVSEDYWKDT